MVRGRVVGDVLRFGCGAVSEEQTPTRGVYDQGSDAVGGGGGVGVGDCGAASTPRSSWATREVLRCGLEGRLAIRSGVVGMGVVAGVDNVDDSTAQWA